MNRLRTSWTVFKHSFGVVRQNGRLLVFPLFGMVAGFGLFAFYLVPLVFHVTTTDVWHGITNPVPALQAMTASMQAFTLRLRAHGAGELVPHFSFAGMAGFYLLSLFTAAFLNVAFYSQIIQALNGGRVSISRGFALALARLPAITGWVLLSGTVGVMLRAIQNKIGALGQLGMALLGLSWSIASVFVIPVIINEPGMRNPIQYLKISGSLIKRTWGEGLIGFVSGWVIGIPAGYAALLLGGLLARLTGVREIAILGMLLGFGVFYLQIVISKVFRCGLYIYATEGVAPGTFNVEDFQRAWIVRRRT